MKNILAALLIIITMSHFLSHSLLPLYNHVIYQTESSSNPSNLNKLQSSESSLEEIAVEVPENTFPCVFFTKESLVLTAYTFPNKLYYSIWLPPDMPLA